MNNRMKILWCGEASFIKTGYGKYTQELLTRLHATGKYEIAEFSSYGTPEDPRRFSIPWKYYGNAPSDHDEHEKKVYRENKRNEFGAWRFEEVVLDFKPHVVIDIRDWWMFHHEETSPFRRFYHWVIMPTADSAPLQEQWMNTFLGADAVFAYSEFGRDVIQGQSNNHVRVVDVCPPGANTDIFKPFENKAELRERVGLRPEVQIVGTVARNQKRKLFPDLIMSFAEFCDTHPKLAENVYLYLHTSYPDVGWDIPFLVKKSGVANKILFSYVCGHCGSIFPAMFQDAKMGCPNCKHPAAYLPGVKTSITEEQLASVYNIFDLYVQYSICEGFGMPQVEAAACGIPIMAVDYSAMSSIVRNVNGYPLQVERLNYMTPEQAFRAWPDNSFLVQRLVDFFSLPETLRLHKGRQAWMGVQKHYTWDLTAKKWDEYLSNLDFDLPSWDDPPRIHTPAREVPNNFSNDEFVKWAIVNIWGEPEKINSYVALRLIRDLNHSGRVASKAAVSYESDATNLFEEVNLEDFTQKNAAEILADWADNRNYWESRRVGLVQESTPKFIEMAKEEYRNG